MRGLAKIAYPAALAAVLVLSACKIRASVPITLSPPDPSAMIDSVRAFADSVAKGITARGPGAWRGYFADTSAFFMASEGQMAFPTSESATKGIARLVEVIGHIELTWGDSIRVDPIAPGLAMMATTYHEVRVDKLGKRVVENGFFTGLAEHRAGGWQFRDAHWSVKSAPPAVP